MGTNYFFFTRNKEVVLKYFGRSYELVDIPEFGYEIHVAKTSSGWLPLFQAYHNCRSVEDLLTAYKSGEFRIYDEYGEDLSWEDFVKTVLSHNGGVADAIPKKDYKSDLNSPFYDKNMPNHIPVSHFEYGNGMYAYRFFKDRQGYEFIEDAFV